jgi:hypothetical protein
MIDPAALPVFGACVACGASVAVSWHSEVTPQGCYVGGGFCRRCGAFLFGLASPDSVARNAVFQEVLGPLAALLV